MLGPTPLKNISAICKQVKIGFAFQKFDYEDPLNLKSLLTEEEIMVLFKLCRLWKMLANWHKLIFNPESLLIIDKKSLIKVY